MGKIESIVLVLVAISIAVIGLYIGLQNSYSGDATQVIITQPDESAADVRPANAAVNSSIESRPDLAIGSLSPRDARFVRRGLPKDLEDLRNRASRGDPEAAYDLYRIHASCTRNSTPEDCRSDEVDVDEALPMLTSAARDGYWPAQAEYLRAMYVFGGSPDEQQIINGMRFLKEAAAAGSTNAMFWLAWYSTNGLDFVSSSTANGNLGALNRIDAYANLLAAAATFEELDYRPNVVRAVREAGLGLSPFEVQEANRKASEILNDQGCCTVWRH